MPDLPNIPLEQLSNRELRLLASNAARAGRKTVAEAAARELGRRGVGMPEMSAVDDARAAPSRPRGPADDGPSGGRWQAALAVGLALIVAAGGAGWWLLGDEKAVAPVTAKPTTTAALPPVAAPEAPAVVADASPLAREAPSFTRKLEAPPTTPRRPLAPPERNATPRGPGPSYAQARGNPAGPSLEAGRLAMVRSEPEIHRTGTAARALLAASGMEIERVSDCAAVADTEAERMICDDALRVARNERRARMSPAPARIVMARNMPAAPLLAAGAAPGGRSNLMGGAPFRPTR